MYKNIEYTLYLTPNGEFYVHEYNHIREEHVTNPPSEDSLKLDSWFNDADIDKRMEYWIEEKKYYSIKNYSQFYLITRIGQLEKKFEMFTERLKRIV